MTFKLSLSNRFRLLSCLAGCFVAVSVAHAADKKPDTHKHHAHKHDAAASSAGSKSGASKKAAKSKEAHKESASKHGHTEQHDGKNQQAGKAKHGAAHTHQKHHGAVAAGAAATGAGAAAAGAAAANTPPAPDAAAQAPATTPEDTAKGAVTGLPLPRYAALRADEVNMRAGPGRRFPILWVYHRRGMPVRIEREFDVWRLVEDVSGQKGWVQQATIAGGRDFLVPGEPPGDESPIEEKTDKNGAKIAASGHMDTRVLGTITTVAEAKDLPGSIIMRSSAAKDATVVAVLKPGTVGSVKECAAGSDWCKVSVKQYNGWVLRHEIWGVDAQEVISPS